MTMFAGLTKFGKSAEQAWGEGAGLLDGMSYASWQSLWEMFQYWIGGKISGLNKFSSKLLNSLSRIGLDSLDGASEGFVQPLMELCYKDEFIDENGNVIKFDKDDNLLERYQKIFNANGGWMSVLTNGTVAAIASSLGEAINLKNLNISSDSTINIDEDTKLASELEELLELEDYKKQTNELMDNMSDLERIEYWQKYYVDRYGNDNVLRENSFFALNNHNKVLSNASYLNDLNEETNIYKLFRNRKDLNEDQLKILSDNKYWIQAKEEYDEAFKRAEAFKNNSKVLSENDLKNKSFWDLDNYSVRRTYLEKNLGIDFENIPENVLTTKVEGLSSNIVQRNSENMKFVPKKVCIEDVVGSYTKPGDTFLEKFMYDTNYDGVAYKHLNSNILDMMSNQEKNFNFNAELMEYNNKFYIGGDGNHRLVSLKLKYLNEISKATSPEEIARIKEKYTITLPVAVLK